MTSEINAAKEQVINVLKELQSKYPTINFIFRAIEGYKLATNNISWREGSKLIIHIADAGAHGVDFSDGDKHLEQGPLLPPYIKKCFDKNIKIIGFQLGSSRVKSFNKLKQIYDEYKSTFKDNGQLSEIYEFKRGSKKEVCQNFKDLVIKAATVAAPKIK